MECPVCGLENPPGSRHCDCGYNFAFPREHTPTATVLSKVSTHITPIYISLTVLCILVIISVLSTREHGPPDGPTKRRADATEGVYPKAPSTSIQSTPPETGVSTAIPNDITYTIEETDNIPGMKRSLDVRLNRPVSKGVLQAIAIKLKNSDPRVYQRTFISYWLPGMKIGSGAWATTHFNPDLDIRIFGLTPEADKAIEEAMNKTLSSGTIDHSRTVIGKWMDETPFALIRGISFYRENGVLYMHREFKDGSSGRVEMVKIGKRFKEKDRLDSGDYYLIDERGNLQLRDNEGLISAARKLR